MQQLAAVALFVWASAGGAGAVDLRGSQGDNRGTLTARYFLTGKMQPEVVAQVFAKVEDEWTDSADDFAACKGGASSGANSTDQAGGCSASAEAFGRSCATIANSVIQASSGDVAVVKEYMERVCGEKVLQGWRHERCAGFAANLTSKMSEDSYNNRENFNVSSLCQGFWAKLSSEEAVRFQKERVEREAEEEKRAKEAVEAAKKAEEERLRAEQEAKAAEAARAAEEAKKKSEDAERTLEEKQEEAAKLAEEAQIKKEKTNTTNNATTAQGNATAVKSNATVPEMNATQKNATTKK